jgi:type I restriction enzyme R subunit
MHTPSFKEDHISQLPALQLLIQLGYTYLNQEEALMARAGRKNQVLLEGVLRDQLRKINQIRLSSNKTAAFNEANVEAGIRALKEISLVEGYITACQRVYELLTLGKALEQSIAGDKKSYTLQYIDWKNPENNVYHVVEEYAVMRSGSKKEYIPDIVLFVNGIPLCIIECKRPDMKAPIDQAISQHLRNQHEDGIRPLYKYAQTLVAVSTNEGRYATNGTPPKFWAHWEEKFRNKEEEAAYEEELKTLKNKAVAGEIKQQLYAGRYPSEERHFEALEQSQRMVTEQDRYLYGLCRPERLLDFTYNFIVFDDGLKKIARYQQYFAIKKTIAQVRELKKGKRIGGVIWHTQGSGKSLTMVMLAQAIAMEKQIRNPKIILVTDRDDLDKQITGTFQKCNMPVLNAGTGTHLVELLHSKSDAVITTIINKFETAVKKIRNLDSPNIFVLVDEGHRSQYGTFNIEMQKALPNACYIALTGTPLFKKDKNTLAKFGTLIDHYTVDKAVKDKAVVPLLYEGRHAFQKVNEAPLDNYFSLVSEPLNSYEKADLKKKFSRADQLNIADQKITAICWDISLHYQKNFQGRTDFKGQLVCSSKAVAIKYKQYLDEIGRVSSELIMSPPDTREGEESAYGETTDAVNSFWKRMMDEHGTKDKYEANIIGRYKYSEYPELIIVVDKLLTGFDAPRNTVLYLTRKLRGHSLLQAIARVNRVHKDKDYGYIIDYYGVIEELGDALDVYSAFEDFDPEDIHQTLTDINDEVQKLPQRHSAVWELFKEVKNKRDAEAYAQLLRDEAIRTHFYERLSAYARILKMALSSIEFHRKTGQEKIASYKEDLKFFMGLRKDVVQRYSDAVDFKQYEGQIQKLIDTHVSTEKVEPITELVNIFDKDAFEEEIEKTVGTTAKADKIASRTARHISEKMEEDPAFYKKFSEMLKETIKAFEESRISEVEYLKRSKEIRDKVLSRTDSDIPTQLNCHEVARAFYGISLEELKEKMTDEAQAKQIAADIALATDAIIQEHLVVDWQRQGSDVPKKMMLYIGDYLIDEVRDKYQLKLSFEEIGRIAEQLVEVAKIRYAG